MKDIVTNQDSSTPTPQPTESAGSEHEAVRSKQTKRWIIIAAAVVVAGVVLWYFLSKPDLSGQIVVPYIAHQKPAIDPHLPSTNALADKLDEVQFDGLFNLVASPSGVVYEDGLGEFLGIDPNNVVTVRLKTARRWHDSWQIIEKDDEAVISKVTDHLFSAADLNFTLRRIQNLGSLSPDYILVSQALPTMGFEGPDDANLIRFQFRGDRIWKDADIKEVLSFKILPDGSDMNALNYRLGTAGYLSLPPKEGVSNYLKSPDGTAQIPNIILAPFIDNSTYATELSSGRINVLLETPFGGLSPILEDTADFFYKSNISNTFFALFLNVERLTREQRREVRSLMNQRSIVDRFFKVGTEQTRHVADYKGNRDNFADYINWSIFPSSTYYVEEEIVVPPREQVSPTLSSLPDTLRLQACMNYGFREEYAELIEILNDPLVTRGRVKVRAVTNEELRLGTYDALLIAVTGYRSNFLFDLYNIFLRAPDLETYEINLVTETDQIGNSIVSPRSFQAENNFFRLDHRNSAEGAEINQLLELIYGFMSTRHIGDKQEYARRVDELEREMCLGVWLFSLPSLAYFSTQFEESSIDLYGVASQLSTIKRWRERAGD
jgi:hypothetical protein